MSNKKLVRKLFLVICFFFVLFSIDSPITFGYPSCIVPGTGDWVVSSSCNITSDTTVDGNIIINNGSIVVVNSNITLEINFVYKYLKVNNGGGLLIKNGAKVTQSTKPTTENLKVAFIGDTGYGLGFQNVLELIQSEGADMVLHQGDFDYFDDPPGFETAINNVLGENYPYFIIPGNHDATMWNGVNSYSSYFLDRMERIGINLDSNDLSDEKYAVTYNGLKMVFVGQNGNNTEFAQFINSEFVDDDQIWRICSWHKNQNAMQVGSKTDEVGWDVYENCRINGAIIATAHEHTYERTKTMIDISTQTVDGTCSDPLNLCVGENRTFVFVNGMSGFSIRNQDRCLPTSYPYGCSGEWANIYTSDQSANYGVLFINFFVDGDKHKADGYFKNIDGDTIDTFTIINDR